MRVVFVLKEWRDSNLSVVKRDDVIDGKEIISGSIYMDSDDEEKLLRAIEEGYYPVLLMNKE